MSAGGGLPAALEACSGYVCLVGAGGKKTTMYTLAAQNRGRVMLTSTSHMYPYDETRVERIVSVGAADAPLPADSGHRTVAFAGPTDTRKRVGGLAAARIREIREAHGYDLCVIKADGARARWIKCPAPHEPIVPAFADTVIPVVAARVIGRPLDERIAHRPAALASLLGIALDTTLTAAHVGTLLADPAGALKGVGKARVVPLINMVDDDELMAGAREAARVALARTARFDRVVLASMSDGRLRAVIER